MVCVVKKVVAIFARYRPTVRTHKMRCGALHCCNSHGDVKCFRHKFVAETFNIPNKYRQEINSSVIVVVVVHIKGRSPLHANSNRLNCTTTENNSQRNSRLSRLSRQSVNNRSRVESNQPLSVKKLPHFNTPEACNASAIRSADTCSSLAAFQPWWSLLTLIINKWISSVYWRLVALDTIIVLPYLLTYLLTYWEDIYRQHWLSNRPTAVSLASVCLSVCLSVCRTAAESSVKNGRR